MQRRVVGALDHDQRIARDVLGGDEPGRATRIRAPADAETAALPDGVALEAPVTADDGALVILDGPGASRQPAADEVAERPLADETDPGRIPLVRDGQPALARQPPDLGLVEVSHRELAVRELPRIERMQEVALVLAGIDAPQQLPPRADARVMAGRESLRAQPLRVVEAHAELDLAVAEHVGVGRAAGLELGEEVREHALAVFRLEAGLVERYAELIADPARILEVRGRRAVAVLVLGPVRHEEGLDAVACVEEEGGSDRRIHAAREADDHECHGISLPPCASRRR